RFGDRCDLRLYLSNPDRSVRHFMNARSTQTRLFAFALSSAVFFALLFVRADASKQQEPGQQRPRTVGSNQNTNRPRPQPTNSSSEEVDEGDVVRVETQLVTVPAVVADKTGRPISTLR